MFLERVYRWCDCSRPHLTWNEVKFSLKTGFCVVGMNETIEHSIHSSRISFECIELNRCTIFNCSFMVFTMILIITICRHWPTRMVRTRMESFDSRSTTITSMRRWICHQWHEWSHTSRSGWRQWIPRHLSFLYTQTSAVHRSYSGRWLESWSIAMLDEFVFSSGFGNVYVWWAKPMNRCTQWTSPAIQAPSQPRPIPLWFCPRHRSQVTVHC